MDASSSAGAESAGDGSHGPLRVREGERKVDRIDVTPASRMESTMKRIRYAIAGLGLLFAVVLLPAPPASATIHEIVAAWCSGHGELEPPGIQGGKNFAQPVNSNGFVGPTVPFTGPEGPGLLITFNYGVAPAK